MVTLARERLSPEASAGPRTPAWFTWTWRAAVVLALAAAVCAVLLVRHVLQVKSDLQSARTAASSLRGELDSGDVFGSEHNVALLTQRIDAADASSRGMLWRLGSHMPLLGNQLTAARSLTLALIVLDRTSLVPASSALTSLQAHPPVVDGAVNLPELAGLTGTLDKAVAGLASTQTMLAAVPSDHLFGSLQGARVVLTADVAHLKGSLVPLQRALHLAPDMLGAQGKRTYFLATQNPAEARATGGLIAAYSIVTVDNGRLSVLKSGTNKDFQQPIGIAATYDDLQAGGGRRNSAVRTFFAVNAEPDWTRVGSELSSLAQTQFGIHIDGVIGLTPRAIARVLTTTGPVSLKDGTAVTGKNAVQFIQVTEYQHYGSQTSARKSDIGDLAQLMVSKLIHTPLSLQKLRKSVTGSLGTGDITIFSTHPAEENTLRQTSVSGALPASPSLVQLVDENTGGGKMDAYLSRTVTVARVPGSADVRVIAVFTNFVRTPAALTDYQASRLDDNRASVTRGSARDLISLYGGVGASAGPVTVDGKPVLPLVESDLDHPRISVDLEIAPGQSRTLVYVLHHEPGHILYRVQPLAVPEKLTITN